MLIHLAPQHLPDQEILPDEKVQHQIVDARETLGGPEPQVRIRQVGGARNRSAKTLNAATTFMGVIELPLRYRLSNGCAVKNTTRPPHSSAIFVKVNIFPSNVQLYAPE